MHFSTRDDTRVIRSAAGLTAAVVLLSGAALRAQVATLDERVAGAERVVVGTARTINSEWRENSHGDHIIVSVVEVEVEETLKGDGAQTMLLEVDGSTIDGLTLRVSSMPIMHDGDRAVFF